jgi:hypothetical protein
MSSLPSYKRAGRELEASDRELLLAGLERGLRRRVLQARSLELEPSPVARSGSHPSERAVCRLANGEVRRFFCKCSKDFTPPEHRHRAGVAYEADVYRRFLESFSGTRPVFFGSVEDRSGRLVFLYLEELQDVLRVSKSERGNMPRAAAWIGRFHADLSYAVEGGRADFLTSYDTGFYRQWPRRALELTRPLREEYPWLGDVSRAFCERLLPVLAEAPRTLIHGEYYPKNILARGRSIYPVDWESAATGPGEIDLASLTEGWPDVDRADCAKAYRRARWPDGPPSGHEELLDAARVYWLFRWLGNGRHFATGKLGRRRLEELGAVARRMDLIPTGAHAQ